jgi:cytochrome P450
MNYVNQLVSILRSHAEQKQPIDIVKYMEFTTSDIISDYCFAESYGQLKSGEQEAAIKGLHRFIPLEAKLSALSFTLKMVFILHILGITQMKVLARAQDQVKRRLESAADQKDMMKRVISHLSEDGDGMSMDELGHNAMVLMLAGSETTSTALAGSMFYLLKNQPAMDNLTKEIRENFSSTEDMTMANASNKHYSGTALTIRSGSGITLSQCRYRRNSSIVFSSASSAHSNRSS